MVNESWLRSENHKEFADAMAKCCHAGGYCAADGFCHFDGECFGHNNRLERRLNEIERRLAALENETLG